MIVDWEQGPPIATLKGRRADEVIAWGKSRSPDESNKVEVVVLDRSKTYFAAVKEVFGDHGQVIDRFPVVQQAGGALDEVRRAVPKQLAPADAKALKKLRKRWLKSAAQRTGDALIARDEWRQRFPPWRATIDWVQDLRRWFNRQ